MDSTAIIAVTGIIAASIVGPTMLSVLTAWQRRTERREDYERQDKMTAAAEARTSGKLAQIHELVNSTLTGAMQSQLVSLEAQLAMIRRWQPDETGKIGLLEDAVAELRLKLDDRAKQTEIADAQVKN